MIKTSKLFKKYCLVSDNPETLFHNDSFAATRLDKKGIFIVDYKYGNYGIQYTPVGVAQYALANYNAFLATGDEKYLTAFFKNCNWLKDNLVERDEYCTWHYKL